MNCARVTEIMNHEKVVKNIREELTTYITKNSIKALVLGISGGIDSALCAALAQPVCMSLGVQLLGRSISIISNKEDEQKRARSVGMAFCTEFKELDCSDLYNSFTNACNLKAERECDKIRGGNIKARIRMIILYDIAGKHKGLVLSTDNFTELLLGFWTLHGDVGDYGMIQNLWKMEVYGMAEYLAVTANEDKKEAILSCVQATPTDGLGITNSDLDQLGVETYAEADHILKVWVRDEDTKKNWEGEDLEYLRKKYANHPIVLRYERTHFKRINPCSISRDGLFGEARDTNNENK